VVFVQWKLGSKSGKQGPSPNERAGTQVNADR
jgi:hypothetical protein